MINRQTPRKQDSDRLYDLYVKPLEKTHKGEYIGVSLKGQTVMGSRLLEVIKQSVDAFGKNNSVVFKVGDKVVGKLL